MTQKMQLNNFFSAEIFDSCRRRLRNATTNHDTKDAAAITSVQMLGFRIQFALMTKFYLMLQIETCSKTWGIPYNCKTLKHHILVSLSWVSVFLGSNVR